MDVFETLNAYSRDYVLHVTGVLNRSELCQSFERIEDRNGKIFTHSLLSLIFGLFLSHQFIMGETLSTAEAYIQYVATAVAYWIFVTLLVCAALRLGRQNVDLRQSLSIVLNTLPVAFLVGAYGAFVGYSAWLGLWNLNLGPARIFAAATDLIIQLLTIAVAMPRAIRLVTEQHQQEKRESRNALLAVISRWCTCILILAFTAIVNFTTMFGDMLGASPRQQPPATRTSN